MGLPGVGAQLLELVASLIGYVAWALLVALLLVAGAVFWSACALGRRASRRSSERPANGWRCTACGRRDDDLIFAGCMFGPCPMVPVE